MNRWTWAAASRCGLSHSLTGERRQDALRVAAAVDGSVIVAVACDGAGSASHGGLGAALAARVLGRCAKTHFASCSRAPAHEDMMQWVYVARQVLAEAAVRRDLNLSDLATTAVVAVSDGRCTTTAHIGDGAILARAVDVGNGGPHCWHALSWPEHGEYVSTTFFLTDASIQPRIAVHAIQIDRMVVMTDGMERLALDFALGVPHEPFLEGVCAPLSPTEDGGRDRPLSSALARYLDSQTVNSRTDDDKTLILAAFG